MDEAVIWESINAFKYRDEYDLSTEMVSYTPQNNINNNKYKRNNIINVKVRLDVRMTIMSRINVFETFHSNNNITHTFPQQ